MRKSVFILTTVLAFHYVKCFTSPPPMTENVLTQRYLEELKGSGYNREILPYGNGGYGSPIDVLCTMYVLDINKVDDRSMDYRAQFYFRQSWNDSRLAYPDTDIGEITLNNKDKIWTPDLFFVQEKEGVHHNVVTENTFVKISPEGEVHYSVRLSVTFGCRMDFAKYPHDIHKCIMSIESYGYTRDKIELSWDHRRYTSPVQADTAINIFPFELKSIKEDAVVSEVFKDKQQYKVLRVEFKFQRKTGFFLNRLYIPFIFLVILSWLSFLIPVEIVSMRLSYLLVILYLMVHLGYGINDFIPPSSSTKGSDVWIAFCESMVFATFLEFIAVYVISRSKKEIEKIKNDPEAQKVLKNETKNNGDLCNSQPLIVEFIPRQSVLTSQRIDRFCMILFPVFFIIFSVIYGVIYCSGV